MLLTTFTVSTLADESDSASSGSIGHVHDAAAIVLGASANFGGGRLRVRIDDGASSANRLEIGGGFTIDTAITSYSTVS